MASTSQQLADERHREWLRSPLDRAAGRFGVHLIAEPVFGWRDRTVGGRVEGPDGEHWLRLVSEHSSWIDDHFWTGNAESAVIADVPKPRVLNVCEWEDEASRVRGELMTLVPGRPCSPTAELRRETLPSRPWWDELRASLTALAGVPTRRAHIGQEQVTQRLRIFFGERFDPTVTRWETAHADLHWANLTCPRLHLLDWETWGIAPAGFDAASLYCYSLLVPAAAQRVYETFSDVLETPDGMRARLYATARLLLRAEGGDHADLVLPLHRAADELLRRFGR